MALQKLLLELEFAVPGASADVVQDDVGHQREQEAHEGVLQDDDRLVAQDALGEALNRGDEHVAAIEDRDRQEVEDREVQIDEHREPEHAADILGNVIVGLRDRDD